VLGMGGMDGKDGGRGGSTWVAARSPRLVSPRNRRSRTQGAGRLGEPCVQFGDEFAGKVAAEGVEEERGGGLHQPFFLKNFYYHMAKNWIPPGCVLDDTF